MHRYCPKCENPANKACGKCKKEYYCSRQCQLDDWKRHKKVCNTVNQKLEPVDIDPPKTQIKRVVPTNCKSFQEQIVIGHTEEESLAVWISNQHNQGNPNILNFKILVQNFNKGSAKMFAKSVFLTAKNKPLRIKVQSTEAEPKFIEINGQVSTEEQATLQQNQFGVMDVCFLAEGGIESCDFIEIPVKIEEKGVIKIRVNFQNVESKKIQVQSKGITADVD